MSKALESGKSLAELVLAKLPESSREAVRAALSAPEASDALTLLGDSALARSDYSRHMDEIREKENALKDQEDTLLNDHRNLSAWYDTNKERLAKVETLEQQIARLSGTQPITQPKKDDPPSTGFTKDELEKYLAERDRGYANVLALGVEVGAKHLHTFGEPPDMRGIIDLATKKGLSLEAAYQEKYGDKLADRAKAEDQARIDKIVAERLAEERKKDAGQPYPLRSQEASVLDVLSQPDYKSSNFGVDAAVAEYERLQSNGSH